jgi:hypothetical protein
MFSTSNNDHAVALYEHIYLSNPKNDLSQFIYLVCLIGTISAVSFEQKSITTPLFDHRIA